MTWWTIHAWASRVVVPLERTIGGLAAVLVAAMCALGVLYVGVLVDDGHHVGDSLRVGLKHLSP